MSHAWIAYDKFAYEVFISTDIGLVLLLLLHRVLV